MVTQDPSENGTKLENSGVWVIRRQTRRKRPSAEDEITPISSYYVIGENIYMASSLGSVLGARLVNASQFPDAYEMVMTVDSSPLSPH